MPVRVPLVSATRALVRGRAVHCYKMDYFSSMFSGGFSLPYEIGERHALCWGKWQHFRATRTTDKKPFSLFRLTASPSDALTLEAARNGVKKLRTVRSASCSHEFPALHI